jgi:DNA-binding protein H-NS
MDEAKLASMPIDELLRLRDLLNKALTARSEALREQLAKLKGGSARPRPPKTNLKPKYLGPNGETWVGKGARPKWLVKLLNDGAKLEDLAITRSRRARGVRQGRRDARK